MLFRVFELSLLLNRESMVVLVMVCFGVGAGWISTMMSCPNGFWVIFDRFG
jgi:hypothetical protein